MSRPEKCSKLSEVEDRECGDRISSLPDELLGHILSFLPTRCAVAMSVLSPRWRCLHMLTNCLCFDVPYLDCETNIKAQKKSFKKFVNRVLLLHKVSPIKKFHFDSGRHEYDDADIHSWVSAVLLKGVEQLDLYLNGNLNALPHRVFSCQTIVELKLFSSFLEGFRVPESIYLPSLKKVDLGNIQFLDMESFGKFISASPLLQDLLLTDCEWPMNSDHPQVCLFSRVLKHLTIIACDNQFEVDAPNLVHLEYYPTEDEVLGLSLKNSDHLVAACLELPFYDNSDSIQVALALIKAVCHVTELHLLADALEYVSFFDDDHPPLFPNLTELYLDSCSCDTWKYVTHWLSNSPRLEKLVFNQSLVTGATGKWPPNVTLVPFSSRLKVIEASNFCGSAMELTLLGYLLRNAKVLKKLILYKKPYVMTRKQELLASKKLLMLPRASRTCVIQLKKEKQN